MNRLALHPYKTKMMCKNFSFHISPRHCPTTAGCSPQSMSSIVFCLLLSCSRRFPPSLLCRLAIFCLVVLLISSHSLVATLCSVWSTCCPSYLLYVRSIPTFVSVCIRQCQLSLFLVIVLLLLFVVFLISEYGILSCSFRPNRLQHFPLHCSLSGSQFVSCLLRDHVWQP